jgi:hypothetical protein
MEATTTTTIPPRTVTGAKPLLRIEDHVERNVDRLHQRVAVSRLPGDMDMDAASRKFPVSTMYME